MAREPAPQLAQVNIARLKAPLDSPLLADFVAGLDMVNAEAEAADGFVWRLQGDGNNATDLRVFDDDWLIVNMSVWRDVDALKAFIYGEQHARFLRRRYEWFERLAEAMAALWWVPAGHLPEISEAEKRVTRLREQGPTPYAFTLKQPLRPELDGWQ